MRDLLLHDKVSEAVKSGHELLAARTGLEDAETANLLDALAEAEIADGHVRDSVAESLITKALSLKRKLYGENAPEFAATLLVQGSLHNVRRDRAAIEDYKQALTICENRAPDCAGEALEGLAKALADKGDYAPAKTSAERALALRKQLYNASSIEYGRGLFTLAYVLHEKGELPETEQLCRTATEIFQQNDAPLKEARSLGLLANALRESGQLAEATPIYKTQLQIVERVQGPESVDVAIPLNNLALNLKDEGDFEAARADLERSFHLTETKLGPDHPYTTIALANLGILYKQVGDYALARDTYLAALAAQEKRLGPQHRLVAATRNSLALVYIALGDYNAARQQLQRALSILESSVGDQATKSIEVILNLGDVMRRLHRYPESTRFYQRALSLSYQNFGANSTQTAIALEGYADLLRNEKDYPAARAQLAEAIAIIEKALGKDAYKLHFALIRMAWIENDTQHYSEALAYARRDENIITALQGPDTYTLSTVLLAEAIALTGLDQPHEAISVALRAEEFERRYRMEIIEAFPQRESLLASDESQQSPLDVLCELATQTRDPSEIANIWDRIVRNRGLVIDALASRTAALHANSDPQARRAFNELTAARERLANLVVLGPPPDKKSNYQGGLLRAREQAETAEAQLLRTSSQFRRDFENHRIGFDQIARSLPSGAALIAYSRYRGTTGDAYLAFILPHAGQSPITISLGPAAVIDRQVRSWHEEIDRELEAGGHDERRNQERCRAAGLALRRSIWDPAKAYLAGAQHVHIVLDGALLTLNPAALPSSSGKFLVEEKPLLSLLNTERDLAADPGDSHGSGLLAIGGPSFDLHEPYNLPVAQYRSASTTCDGVPLQFSPLPQAAAEVHSIAQVWTGPAVVLDGTRATEAAFKELSSGRRVIHIATHAFFERKNCGSTAVTRQDPLLRAGLAFAGANERQSGPGNDGILMAEEAASLDLAGTDWVVLSGCSTGTGDVQAGEGVLGLRRAFRAAGARTVITSLWPVNDEEARAWMILLYQGRFSRHLGTAEAIRAADLRILAERRRSGLSTHPAHWAAFVSGGDWR